MAQTGRTLSAKEIMSKETMSVERKVALISGRDMWNLKSVREMGLGSVTITDGPHGLRKTDPESNSILLGLPATCFPTASGLAASWDPHLLEEVGSAIGREAKAQGVAVVLGPGANIKRHPLCGRNFEYFSEDPLLTGAMAGALIMGIQSTGIGTSLKHFAVNNQETMRMVVDVIVDERTLREIYLAGFEGAIKLAAPTTVMCAYNKLNGVYGSENHWLLTEILRDEWGSDALVMTDWGATNDRAAGVSAGLDLEMPGSAGMNDSSVLDAISAGRLGEHTLDRSVERAINVLAAGNEALADPEPCDYDQHHELARRAAAESAVLLTNNGLLPLDRRQDVAIIGGFALDPRYQGAGSSMVTPTRLDTALDAARTLVGDAGSVSFAQGYVATSDDIRPDLIAKAVEVAGAADVAVVFAGLPPSYESEAYDRPHLRLPHQHIDLISKVAEANPNTVVVLSNGAPVVMPWIDKPAAILEAYLGGQAGGSGIVDVLFGDVTPGGKLAETFPIRQSDVGSDPWFPGVGRQVQYREGVYIGYRWFDSAGLDVAFPFGHGLSYTTFDYSNVAVTADSANADDEVRITVRVDVTNTGERVGSEVIQLYVRPLGGLIERPDRELKAFEKVHLDPGASHAVVLHLDSRCFAHFDTTTNEWQIEGGTYELLVGSSSRDIRFRIDCEIQSDFVPASHADDEAIGSPTRESVADESRFIAMLGHPIPPATPVRPFTRNSTLGEASAVLPGVLLTKLAQKMVRVQFGDSLDENLTSIIEHALTEAPLRVLASSSRGKISLRTLDTIVGVLNTWPHRSVRAARG